MTKVYSATESFLEIIGNQIYTQENAQAVMDELRDHVLTSTTDYLALGYSEEEAEAKALKQMGEPSELGKAFNDPKEAARRAMWRRAYRVLALVLPLSFIVVLSWPFLMSGDIYRIGRPSLRGAVTEGVDFLNLYNVINLLVIGTVLNSRYIGKCSYLGFKLKPLLVVWPVRKRVRLDLVWLAVGITFGGPMLVAYYMPAFAEGFEPRWFFMESYLLLSVVGAWLAYRRSEVHRIPKVIVSSEGMVIREKFISWTAIDSFSWMRIKVGDNHYYKLKLKNAQGRRIADEIEVSQNQKSIMDSLLAVHMSKGGLFLKTFKALEHINRWYIGINAFWIANLIIGLLVVFNLWWHRLVLAFIAAVVLSIVLYSHKSRQKKLESAHVAKEPQQHYAYYRFYRLPKGLEQSEVVCYGAFDRGYPKGFSVYKFLQWGVVVVLLLLFYSDLVYSWGYIGAALHGLVELMLIITSCHLYKILNSHSAIFLKDQVIFDNKQLLYSDIKKSQVIELKNQHWRIEANTGKRYFGFELSTDDFEKFKKMAASAL